MLKEIQLIISLLLLTGIPIWVLHWVLDKVSGFPVYISIVMHAALFGSCYGIIKLII